MVGMCLDWELWWKDDDNSSTIKEKLKNGVHYL